MKINVIKELTLLELLQKFDAGEVPEGRYYSETYPKSGIELEDGVEEEVEITENTKLDHLIEIAKGDLIHTYEHDATINEVLDENSEVFYTLIDGELVKIWEREQHESN